MRFFKDTRGLTLIETIIYMGILTILLSAFLGILTQMLTVHARNSQRSRLAESAWTALNTLIVNLETANAVTSTSSVYDTDLGLLVFKNADGVDITVDTEVQTQNINGNIFDVNRLRYVVSGAGHTTYITDSDVEVWLWEITPVRNADGILTGLNLSLGIEVMNRQAFGYQQGRILYTTTVHLNSQTQEL